MADRPARRAHAHQEFGYTTLEGDQRELKAGGDGVVRPQTDEDVRILDTFDLPVVRSTKRSSTKRIARRTRKTTTRASDSAAPATTESGGDTADDKG